MKKTSLQRPSSIEELLPCRRHFPEWIPTARTGSAVLARLNQWGPIGRRNLLIAKRFGSAGGGIRAIAPDFEAVWAHSEQAARRAGRGPAVPVLFPVLFPLCPQCLSFFPCCPFPPGLFPLVRGSRRPPGGRRWPHPARRRTAARRRPHRGRSPGGTRSRSGRQSPIGSS